MNYLSIILTVALAAQCLGFSQNRPSHDTGILESNGSPFDEDLLDIKVKYDDDILNDAGKPLDSIGLANPDALSLQNSDNADEQLQETNNKLIDDLPDMTQPPFLIGLNITIKD